MTQMPCDLSFPCSRRTFWRALLQEMCVTITSIDGQENVRLSELGTLPNHKLARIRPAIAPECSISMDGGYVCARHKAAPGKLQLFPIERQNLLAFNLFDGRHELGDIARHVALEMGWDEPRGFAHTRELFLSLVARLVAVPGNAPESES